MICLHNYLLHQGSMSIIKYESEINLKKLNQTFKNRALRAPLYLLSHRPTRLVCRKSKETHSILFSSSPAQQHTEPNCERRSHAKPNHPLLGISTGLSINNFPLWNPQRDSLGNRRRRTLHTVSGTLLFRHSLLRAHFSFCSCTVYIETSQEVYNRLIFS